jgi:hypothetical protein
VTGICSQNFNEREIVLTRPNYVEDRTGSDEGKSEVVPELVRYESPYELREFTMRFN